MIIKNGKTISSIYKGSQVIDKIYKGTLVVYEAFKELIVSGVPPLTLTKCKGVDLADYKIYGESVQDGTPTPEAPIEIESVGEKTINVLNPVYVSGQSVGLTYTRNADNSFTINGTCTSDNTFAISTDNGFVDGDTTEYTLCGCYGGSTSTYYLQTQNGYRDTGNGVKVNTKNDKNIIRLFVKAGTVFDNVTIYPMLVKGNHIGNLPKYEPYGKYKIPVKSSGKNLVNIPDTPIFDTYFYVIRDEDALKVANELPRNEILYSNYYIEQAEIGTGGGGNYRQIGFFDVNDTQIGYLRKSGGYIEEGEIAFIRVYAYNSNYQEGQKITNIMVTRTPEDISSYEPYIEPITTNIYLNEPLRKIGDYADYIDFENKKVVRNVGIINNLDNLGWMATSNYFQAMITNFNINVQDRTKALCNYLQYGNALADYSFWFDSSGTGIRIKNSDYTDLTLFKGWLETLNIYAVYPLATLIEETIELPNIPTLKGTTILSVDTEIQPSNMEVVYKEKPTKLNNIETLEKTDVSIIEEKLVKEVEE